MTTIVNFYGGPGAGKSTLAAGTFALLKNKGLRCELVFEYVKEWAWEKRVPSKYDELYIFGQQVRRETVLYGKVDFLLTDRPLRLSPYYADYFGQSGIASAMTLACEELERLAQADGHKFVNVFVERVSTYDGEGRYQTEEQATNIDAQQSDIVKFDYRLTKLQPEWLAKELAP
jgi:hypothetical protein